VEPTSVQEPNTPAELAISLFNQLSDFTSIPRDLAVEFSPYWIATGDLDREKDMSRNVLESLMRTLTVSLATAEIADTTMGLGIGLRTSVLSGSVHWDQRKERELETPIRLQRRALESTSGFIWTRP
jgi:hypothetical protein